MGPTLIRAARMGHRTTPWSTRVSQLMGEWPASTGTYQHLLPCTRACPALCHLQTIKCWAGSTGREPPPYAGKAGPRPSFLAHVSAQQL